MYVEVQEGYNDKVKEKEVGCIRFVECAGCERIYPSSSSSVSTPTTAYSKTSLNIPLSSRQGNGGNEKRLKESGVSLNMMLKCIERLVDKPLSEEQEVGK